jgi:hypothetical protein
MQIMGGASSVIDPASAGLGLLKGVVDVAATTTSFIHSLRLGASVTDGPIVASSLVDASVTAYETDIKAPQGVGFTMDTELLCAKSRNFIRRENRRTDNKESTSTSQTQANSQDRNS